MAELPVLTAAQERALRALAPHDYLTPAALARILWPDSPAWDRTTRSRPGFNGAKGGTMPMNAARLLWRLRGMGLAYIEGNARWSITEAGRGALSSPDSGEGDR